MFIRIPQLLHYIFFERHNIFKTGKLEKQIAKNHKKEKPYNLKDTSKQPSWWNTKKEKHLKTKPKHDSCWNNKHLKKTPITPRLHKLRNYTVKQLLQYMRTRRNWVKKPKIPANFKFSTSIAHPNKKIICAWRHHHLITWEVVVLYSFCVWWYQH